MGSGLVKVTSASSMTGKTALLLLVAQVVVSAITCAPSDGTHPSGQRPEGDVVSIERWPFLACVDVVVDAEKSARNGVKMSDVASAMARSGDLTLRGYRELVVTTNGVDPVHLGDVADVDICLVRRQTTLATEMLEPSDVPRMHSHAYARLSVEFDAQKLAEIGVAPEQVHKLLAGLSGTKEHYLTAIRNESLTTKDGQDVRLGDIAEVDVIWWKRSKEASEASATAADDACPSQKPGQTSMPR